MASQTLPKALSVGDALSDYILSLKSERARPKTLETNTYVIKRFIHFVGEDCALDKVQTQHLRKLMVLLQSTPTRYGKPPSDQTVHTFHRKLRRFFAWCVEEGYLDGSPMQRVRAPTLERRILPALTPDEIKRIDSHLVGSTFKAVRDRALFYMMLDSAIRLQECVELRACDVNLLTGQLHIRCGKMGKSRMTQVGATTLRVLNRYARMAGVSADRFFWQGERGRLTRAGIKIVFLKLSQRSRVHIHPHKLRRTCALQMLRNGCDVYSLQRILGHSDLQVLRRYLDQTEGDVSVALRDYGVVDRLHRRC